MAVGTAECKVVAAHIGNTELVIVDCPGFDDTVKTDTEILREITEMLSALYLLGLKLRCVLYLHDITHNRMPGSAMKNLQLFMKLVGTRALSNVVFVTTMWGKMQGKDDEKLAKDRDNELRDEYWEEFLRKGASATRFDGTQASAQGILAQILGKKTTVVLKVQRELVEKNLSLRETTAGAYLEPAVQKQGVEFDARVQELKKQLEVEKDRSTRFKVEKFKKTAEAQKDQNKKDLKTLETKPGVEVKARLERFKEGGLDVLKTTLQALAAVVTISFSVANFVNGIGGF